MDGESVIRKLKWFVYQAQALGLLKTGVIPRGLSSGSNGLFAASLLPRPWMMHWAWIDLGWSTSLSLEQYQSKFWVVTQFINQLSTTELSGYYKITTPALGHDFAPHLSCCNSPVEPALNTAQVETWLSWEPGLGEGRGGDNHHPKLGPLQLMISTKDCANLLICLMASQDHEIWLWPFLSRNSTRKESSSDSRSSLLEIPCGSNHHKLL